MLKLLMILKRFLPIYLLLACMLGVTFPVYAATKSNEQILDKRISIAIENQSLKEALDQVARAASVPIIYGSSKQLFESKVSIHAKNEHLKKVLDELLKPYALTYRIIGEDIVISQIERQLKQSTPSRKPTQIEGKVLDEQGKPLSGASVKLKSGYNGVITDGEGHFTLTQVPDTGMLYVSYVGYQTAESPYNINRTQFITIQLKADANSLNEVQVIGYGTATKKLNTGSISVVTAKEIENQPVTNVLSALSGRAAGVYVQTNNGLAGGDVSIQIRGPGSLAAGTDPFYVIDGVPFVSSSMALGQLASGINGAISPFNSLNPEDIESISILKDADATAIYGSRGANGVVLITTKKGKKGGVKTDVTLSSGISQVADLPKLLNLKDYLAIGQEAFKNDGLIPSSDPNSQNYAPDLTVWSQAKSTDWAEYMLGGTGHLTNLQASVSGGDEQTSFTLGANYRVESTVLPGENKYARGGMHMSVQYTSADRRFNISMSSSYTQDSNQLVNPAISLSGDILLPPNFPIYNQDGSYNFLNGNNPVANSQNTTNVQTSNVLINALVSYNILPGLQIKASAGLNNLEMKQVMVNPGYAQDPNSYEPLSNSYFGDNTSKSVIIEPQLNYSLKLNKSSLNVLVGGTYQKTETNGELIYATNFNSDNELQNLSSAATIQPSNTYLEYKYASVFGRVTYNWDDKYIINGSVRRDGSSRFGPGHQYGNFGAVGLAWLFSNESWIKNDISWLSFGKLRLSYGITGNDQIPDYQYLSTYGSSGITYQNLPGLIPTRITNADLHWESTKKLNAGFDAGIAKDRLMITINYFVDRSSDQLVSYSLPYITGFDGYEANLPAVIQNQGWEFELTSKNMQSKAFSWSTSFNFTTSTNFLKSFPGLSNSPYANTDVIGQSILRYYGFKFLGVDPQSGADIYQVKGGGTSSNPPFNSYFLGSINLNPAFYGGMNNSFTYKDFQFDLFMQFAKHGLPGGLQSAPGQLMNNFEFINKRWQHPGDVTNVPKATTINTDYNYPSSTANFFNASYLRIKTASLSYTFPRDWTRSKKMERLRIYAQGENLMTLWNRNTALYDPESGINGVPPLRTIVVGVQITL
ncbi:SusC/RagA family TonB-linked outer membrane protein [Mucilaginibacter sp. X5P1]|uniref:SusC/RagA family TonB-linked outer membrane protein n=1 Tax=Mucilaginibacter sp. X5P1 TaxID=2723088 RepID=UPI001610FA3B|nr:SusC/RagA family TonB-linked outer membrane protein [Mucilaginibacter sp. X5P1]MBB6137699.1 TonB-linked SusC/RagA family outer membrane protein [Mucilaginibacter sp. X5P1]